MKNILISTGGSGGHVVPAKILSEHFVLSYDAPTKFYNRRNEVLIQVDYSNW